MGEMGGSPTTRCSDATGQGREPRGTNWTHLSTLRTSLPALTHRSLRVHSAMRRTIPQRIVLWLPPNPRLKEHLAGAFHRADHSLPASPSASPPTVLRHPGGWPFAPHGTAGGVPFRGHATSSTHALSAATTTRLGTAPATPPTQATNPRVRRTPGQRSPAIEGGKAGGPSCPNKLYLLGIQ